jgi:glutaminase
MELNSIISNIYKEILSIENKGDLANYIPELANVNPEKFGVHIKTINNEEYGVGDYNEKFSIQSISKVLSLTLAYNLVGENIWKRVGVEPSGTAFNSLIQLENDNGIPRNPFINSGAIVITDILLSELNNPREDFLSFVRGISNNNLINYSTKIAESEKSVGYKNIAKCNFMKAFGNIKNRSEDVLDLYFDLCSLEMDCKEISTLFMYLANNGKSTVNDLQIITKSQSKRINALMQTCGFYDESGEFAFEVGLPGKSGVGGGIIAVLPNQYAITVWSPKLNTKGNSYRGMKFLEQFTTKTELSIF